MTTKPTDKEIDDRLAQLEDALNRHKEALTVYEEKIKGRKTGKTTPASNTSDTSKD